MRGWMCVPMMTLCLLLTGCGGGAGESPAAEARAPYRDMAGCAMEAAVSCDQDGTLWQADLRCAYTPEGETTVEVLSPETIAGVRAVLSGGGGRAGIRGPVPERRNGERRGPEPHGLPAGADGRPAGGLAAGGEPGGLGGGLLRPADPGPDGAPMGARSSPYSGCGRTAGRPLRGEIAVDGETVLTADFTSFAFYDTIQHQE